MVELRTHANILKHVRAALVVQETVNHCDQNRQAFCCASYCVHFYSSCICVNGWVFLRVGAHCLRIFVTFIYNQAALSLSDPWFNVIGVLKIAGNLLLFKFVNSFHRSPDKTCCEPWHIRYCTVNEELFDHFLASKCFKQKDAQTHVLFKLFSNQFNEIWDLGSGLGSLAYGKAEGDEEFLYSQLFIFETFAAVPVVVHIWGDYKLFKNFVGRIEQGFIENRFYEPKPFVFLQNILVDCWRNLYLSVHSPWQPILLESSRALAKVKALPLVF